MSELYQCLSHSKWDCKYHVVFVAQATAQSNIRADAPSSGTDFPCAGPAKGMSDYRRTPDAGPCAYVHRDSPQAPRGFGDWVSEREKCHCDCPAARQGTEFLGRTFLGPGIRRLHRRLRTGAGPSIHPRAGFGGWSNWTILKQPIRRATRDA